MDRQHLTDRLIAGLEFAPDNASRYEINDASVENLAVRVGAKKKSFILVARFKGKDKSTSRRTLGKFPSMNTAAARSAAQIWNEKIQEGIDPAEEINAEKTRELMRQRSTFASVMEDYIAYLPTRERNLHTVKDIKFIRAQILNPKGNPWLHKPISDVTDEDVIQLVMGIVKRGAPTQAFHCFKTLKTFFSWVMVPPRKNDAGMSANPIEYIRANQLRLRINQRVRVFEYEEARAFLLATTTMPYPYGPCLRALIETGQRKGAVSGMRWSQINFERKIWTIPGSHSPAATAGRTSKGDGDHLVPLSNRMVNLLREIHSSLPDGHGDFVFSASNGRRPLDNFSRLKFQKSASKEDSESDGADLDATKGAFERIMLDLYASYAPGREMKPWVWHDVRRTVRTHLEPITGRTEVAETAIGHGQTGIVRVYNLHKYRAEIRRAFNAWSELLRKVEEGTCTIADWEHDEEAGEGYEP